MPRFYFNKLVRDKVIENCLNDPLVLETEHHVLQGLELKKELIAKIHEEAGEIPVEVEATSDVKDELADLQEVVDMLRKTYMITREDVAAIQLKKREKKGSFDHPTYIEYVELDERSEWIEVFRTQPHKYREVRGDQTPVVQKGMYRHNKTGDLYEVAGSALHTETNEMMVMYRPLYNSQHEMFVRPYDMFMEMVEVNGEMKPRFEKVEH